MALYEENGFWHFRIALEGREHCGTTGIPAHPDERIAAENFEKKTYARLLAGETPIAPISFSDAVAKFLQWAKGEYSHRTETFRRHAVSCKVLVRFFADKSVHRIGPGEIEDFKANRRERVAEVTTRHDLFTLSVFFRFAILNHWAEDNPVRKVKMPSDKHSWAGREITPEEEVKYFKPHSGFRNLQDFARLMLDLGLRPQEAVSLRKEDYDQMTGQIQIRSGKTRSARRALALTPACKKLMAERLRMPGPWLFPGPDPEKHIVKFNSQHRWLLLSRGLRFRLYDFRHTFATRKARSGVAQTTLAGLLGHNSTKILMRYVHPSQDDMNSVMLAPVEQPGKAALNLLPKAVYMQIEQLPKDEHTEIMNAAIAEVLSVGLPTGKEGHACFREFLDDALMQAYGRHRKRRWDEAAGIVG